MGTEHHLFWRIICARNGTRFSHAHKHCFCIAFIVMHASAIAHASPSPAHQQRLRVREMLRDVRQHQLAQLSRPAPDVASVLQTGTTSASASAFGDPVHDATGREGLQVGGGIGGGGRSTSTEVIVCVVSMIALVGVFLVLGQCVDALMGTIAPTTEEALQSSPAHATKDAKGDHDTHVVEPSSTIIMKIISQMLFNVALVAAPYYLLLIYAPESLVSRYYAIVAAFWVVSLHAQQQLRNRFGRLFESEEARVDAEAAAKRRRDATLLAAHQAEAAAAVARKRQQNSHQSHVDVIHRPQHADAPAMRAQARHHVSTHAPLPRNSVPQPASHTSPTSSPSPSSSLISPVSHAATTTRGFGGFGGVGSDSGDSGYGDAHRPGAFEGGGAGDFAPVQFHSGDLLSGNGMLQSSQLDGGGLSATRNGIPRETDIRELFA